MRRNARSAAPYGVGRFGRTSSPAHSCGQPRLRLLAVKGFGKVFPRSDFGVLLFAVEPLSVF